MEASSQDGPVVTLTATVEERFVNTLIPRDGEPDYVPTNPTTSRPTLQPTLD